MYLAKYDLSGRRAFVTGGAQGIGAACVRALAEAGADVVIGDLNPDRAATTAAEIAGATGRTVEAVELEVTDVDAVAALADRLNRDGSIDILVNNAGIALSDTPAEEMTNERWHKVIDVNLNGTYWCCREFGRAMLGRGRGAIVNLGSMSGYIVNKPQPQAHYNASKAAVHHLTKSLAAEWATRGVRVNAVAPTYIETPLTRFGIDDAKMFPIWIENTPMARVGQPDEIASVVLFLASDAASLLTGSIVVADAGYTCW